MSVLPNDLVLYGSANMTETDGVTVGGAVDMTRKVVFYDIDSGDTCDVISSQNADTGTKITVYGRDLTGAVQSYTQTLNGRTWVTGSQIFNRFLYAAITGATANGPVANPGGFAATGDVLLAPHNCVIPSGAVTTDGSVHTCQAGSAQAVGSTPPLMQLQAGDGASVNAGQIVLTVGGTGPNQIRQIIATSGYGTDAVAVSRNWGVVPDATTTYKILRGMMFDIVNSAGGGSTPVTAVIRCFSTSASDVPTGSSRTYFEKVFSINNNISSALTSAQIQIASDTPTLPTGAALDIGLTTSLADATTIANRQTAPAGISFVTQPALVNVPSGSLPPGAAPNTAGAQAVWLRLTLQPGTAPYKGVANVSVLGSTT